MSLCRVLAGSMLGMEGAGSGNRVGVGTHVLRTNDIITMLEQSSHTKVRETLRQKFYKELVGLVTPQLMLEICDAAGISRKPKGVRSTVHSNNYGATGQGFHSADSPNSL